MKYKDYYRAANIADAFAKLCSNPDNTMLLAGGTDVFLKAREKDWYADKVIIDLSAVKELKKIEETESDVIIGSMSSLTAVHESPIVNKYIPILAEACGSVGSPQIRNKGTIGGNIVNACPAADSIPALMVLNAKIGVSDGKRERIIPIADFFKDCKACLMHDGMNVRTCFFGNAAAKKTVLCPGEIVTKILIPKLDDSYIYYFRKVGRRRALSMSKFNLAILIRQDENKIIRDFRLNLGAVFSKPVRFAQLENELIGKNPTKKEICSYIEKLSGKIFEFCGKGKNTKYKYLVCSRLCKRTLFELLGGKVDGY